MCVHHAAVYDSGPYALYVTRNIFLYFSYRQQLIVTTNDNQTQTLTRGRKVEKQRDIKTETEEEAEGRIKKYCIWSYMSDACLKIPCVHARGIAGCLTSSVGGGGIQNWLQLLSLALLSLAPLISVLSLLSEKELDLDHVFVFFFFFLKSNMDLTGLWRAFFLGHCAISSPEDKAEMQTLHHKTFPHVLMSSPRKQRLRSSPAHSWTPTMPKIKKTKKQRRRTFPSIGRVSNSNVTKIRIPT